MFFLLIHQFCLNHLATLAMLNFWIKNTKIKKHMDKVQPLGDIFSWIVDKNVNITWSDLRISSLQCWFATPTHRSFTPESCRSLLLRSNSLRQEDWELTTEDRSSQLVSVRLQSVSLKIMNAKTNNTVINMYSFCNKESLDLAIFFFCLLMNSDLSIS